jgi:hypothetical protein
MLLFSFNLLFPIKFNTSVLTRWDQKVNPISNLCIRKIQLTKMASFLHFNRKLNLGSHHQFPCLSSQVQFSAIVLQSRMLRINCTKLNSIINSTISLTCYSSVLLYECCDWDTKASSTLKLLRYTMCHSMCCRNHWVCLTDPSSDRSSPAVIVLFAQTTGFVHLLTPTKLFPESEVEQSLWFVRHNWFWRSRC